MTNDSQAVVEVSCEMQFMLIRMLEAEVHVSSRQIKQHTPACSLTCASLHEHIFMLTVDHVTGLKWTLMQISLCIDLINMDIFLI